jgi:uncharacterized protein
MVIFLLFIVSILAFCLSAVCGGGASLLLIPILGIVLPAAQVPAAVSIGTVFSSGTRIAVFYKEIRWDVVRWFVPAAMPAVFLGAFLLRFLNPLYLEVIMGFFLVGNLPSLFKKPDTSAVQHKSKGPLVIIGFLAGFLSGLTGAVGLIFNRFYLRYGLSKEQIVATRAANEILLHAVKLVLYIFFGLISGKAIGIGLTIAIAASISSWIMKAGLKKISTALFQKIGYGAMVLAGVSMLGQSGTRIFSQNNASLSLLPISDGFESKLQWQGANLALEFEYSEGFEFEQEIPMKELSAENQTMVLGKNPTAERIIIEEVFGIGKHSYEAYYLKDGKLVEKIDF